MKNTFLIFVLFITIFSCNAQILPLRTYTQIPSNSYIKDLDNELPQYEGTWKGVWNSKTLTLTIKKITRQFTHLENNPYQMDILIGKFKVTNSNGQVLFDNTTVSDDNAKIKGGKIFSPSSTKYSLTYSDSDICDMIGMIMINFTNLAKTEMKFTFSDWTDIITPDCPYYNANPFPEPLPKNIILTKQ